MQHRTLTRPAEAVLREKGSKFLAVVEPVESVEAARTRLGELRDQYRSATHVCWAWRMIDGSSQSGDDGEPSGTAGLPILRALEGADLIDVLAAVVRWYGGTKLGRGGLIRAYGGAVREALEGGNTRRVLASTLLEIEATYPQFAKVERRVNDSSVAVQRVRYEASVVATLRVSLEKRTEVEGWLSDLGVRFRKQQ